MNLKTRISAKLLRFFFDNVVLKKKNYPMETAKRFQEEERRIATSEGQVRTLFHWPVETGEKRERLPVMVMIHGGGFVFGQPEHESEFCRRMAENVGCLVVNPDYARAPEHVFPKALHQCYELVSWLADHADTLGIDPARIAVGGHSAGGTLAAGVVAMAVKMGHPKICFQILDYPFLDAATPPGEKTFHIPKPLINPGLADLFNRCYLADGQNPRDPLASPLFAHPDSLKGHPPTLVITAEQDLLRDEADSYAAKLKAAGVDVHHEIFPGVDHAFTHIGPKRAADEAWRLMEQKLTAAFFRTQTKAYA